MQEILQSGIDGIALGSIIALAAVGLTLTYGILRLQNYAHGDVLTLGAYVAFFANTVLKLNIWLSFVIGCVGAVIFLLICEKILWAGLRKKRASETTMLIVSVGLALVMRNGIILLWGASPQKYDLPTFPALNFMGLIITRNSIVVIVMAIAVIAGLYYLLQNTQIGKAMRAVADNPELARVTGINVETVILWTWIMAGTLTALGGGMYGLITNVRPTMGWYLILPMFAAVILGGVGNPYGAIAGAMVIGVAQEVSTVCPASLGNLAKYCIGTEYKIGVGLLIMVLVLLFKPQGLFKTSS
ncbi:branched-chain amino acid ABC-type transport system, permease component [Synechococcus sp. PCC 7502]|uniref:branched-chain amino acid ABC transporter permease n=1 Tax=Synechococcus sp. PCC 7502 TaxID=1173263 RepID=UPI00029FBB4F|nr:branched-chain amino acid ABC transporter permease [Synechococcus sp. PCC 7502]AFY75348.1 branched-chain amino acid ABC-type transport system, permease component [Synechococcus sp. PCC 7502]